MVTVVNSPAGTEDSGAGGWAVAAVIILLVVLFAIFLWPRLPVGGGAQPQGDSASINVNIPTGGSGGGETGGGAGGGQQ
jgi:hypothetical protein